MIAKFAGPIAAVSLSGIDPIYALIWFLSIWYLTKIIVGFLICDLAWNKTLKIWYLSPLFLLIAGIFAGLQNNISVPQIVILDSFTFQQFVILCFLPACIATYEAMYWIPFFAIVKHDVIEPHYNDDAWQFSEVVGTAFGIISAWQLYDKFGIDTTLIIGALIAILAILANWRLNKIEELKVEKIENDDAEDPGPSPVRWDSPLYVAVCMAIVFGLLQAFSLNWLRVTQLTGEISLKEGVQWYVFFIVGAEILGWVCSIITRYYLPNSSSRKYCKKCEAHDKFHPSQLFKGLIGRSVKTSFIKPSEKKKNLWLECHNVVDGKKCDNEWEIDIRKQWQFPLGFVILGCAVIIFARPVLFLDVPRVTFIGYLLILAAKAGVLRRVEATDTRHIMMDRFNARGPRERTRFLSNILVPFPILLTKWYPADLLLWICIACSIVLLYLSTKRK